MINFLKDFFCPRPGTKLKKAIVIKQEKAMQLQRNGKLREYAVIMSEIENLEKKYEEVVNENR